MTSKAPKTQPSGTTPAPSDASAGDAASTNGTKPDTKPDAAPDTTTTRRSSSAPTSSAHIQTQFGVTQLPAQAAPTPRDNTAAVADLRTFLTDLVRAQCELLDALAGCALIPGSPVRPAILATHIAPTANLGQAQIARLEALAKDAAATASDRTDTITIARSDALYDQGTRHTIIACPLAAEGRIEGACALLLSAKPTLETRLALREAALVAKTFETYLWRQHCHAEAAQRAMLAQTVELLDAVQQAPDAGSMAGVFCDELRRRFACARVSVSLINSSNDLALMGVSGADQIDRKGSVAEALRAAMEECAAQDAEILYPLPPELESDPASRRVTRDHDALARTLNPGGVPGAVASLPLRVEDDLVGVITLEREAHDPFPVASLVLLRVIAQTIGPALWTRRMADRSVFAVARDQAATFARAAVGPRHTAWKLTGAIVAASFLAAALIPIPDRVLATARVEAAQSRTVVPPFQGFLSSVRVKPNDPVRQGEELASMDVENLRLELARAQSNQSSLTAQRDDAMARNDLSKARVLEAQIHEAQATIDQLQQHIDQGIITSPINGVIGRGDLERLVGAPVEPTQALFEIVGEERTITLEVDERDASRIGANQPGKLVLKSDPSRAYHFTVTRIHPIADARQGRNIYTLEAKPDNASDAAQLLPGMTGSAKLAHGRTTLLSRLLRPVWDEARLRLWW
jgi:hypothetical protein